MNSAIARIFFSAFMLSAAAAFALTGPAGVAVTVSNAQGTAFQGTTDSSGRFVTGPLAPGVYTIELRSLKTAAPARYYLSLSGARPVGEAMGNFLALKMQAEVTSTKPMTGEVRSNRVIVVPAQAAARAKPTQPAVASSATARTPSSAVASSTPPTSATAQPRPGSTPPITTTAPVPLISGATAAAALATARPSALMHQPVSTQARTINGRRYVWQPSSPGSTQGRWIPAPARTASHPAGTPTAPGATPAPLSAAPSRQ